MNWIWGIGMAVSVAALAGAGMAEEAQPLKVGDKAPNFKLTGSDGKEYTLEQFRGKSAVAIAWYPKALTGG
jgi:peroxiredoxin Q/BCP